MKRNLEHAVPTEKNLDCIAEVSVSYYQFDNDSEDDMDTSE